MPSPEIIYGMSSEENYTEDYVSAFDHAETYQLSPGATYGFMQRLIYYNGSAYNFSGTVNTTGFNLWSGQNLVAPAGVIVPANQKNLHVCTKNIDTGEVLWYDCYGASRTVPAGIQLKIAGTIAGGSGYVDGAYLGVPLTGGSGSGAFANILVVGGAVTFIAAVYNPSGGYAVSDVLSADSADLGGAGSGFTYTITSIARTSDGTERRFAESNDKAFPQLIDPRTGNTWLHVNSYSGAQICTVYMFRPDEDFQQIISPLMPTYSAAHMEPLGISDDWVYIAENSAAGTYDWHLCLVPREITAQETAVDYLLTYAIYDFPTHFNDTIYGPNAFSFTTDQTVYFLGMKQRSQSGGTITRDYKLYRFDEPTSAPFGGPVTGGGFTDITPWAAGTGPNTNAASYNARRTAGFTAWNQPTDNFVYYMKESNQLAMLSKFFSWQTSNASTVVDPALTFFDLTYYDIAEDGFDYHHAFVTGYMDADWNPLPSGTGAAWIVIDAMQVNQFAAKNTYEFPGYDYSAIWLSFVVQPYDVAFTGPDQSLWHTIFVKYQLEYGSAPTVIAIYDEQGWDDRYTEYAAEIGYTNVVWNSQGVTNQDYISNSGLFDNDNNDFWWGGESTVDLLPPASLGGTTSPFLRLSFSHGDHPNIQMWTYELDGHEMLVIPLQTETLVYDFLMAQWHIWANGEEDHWAAQTGINWNANLGDVMNSLSGEQISNVVCGDRITSALYFLDPELNEDYSNRGVAEQPFQRVITGQLVSRTADSTSLPMVEVTASDGEDVTATNMTVDLQYSDDRGHNFYSFGVRTVTEGQYGIQLNWRSLGSYTTPGRLLKLIDYGALTRVDDWTVPDDG